MYLNSSCKNICIVCTFLPSQSFCWAPPPHLTFSWNSANRISGTIFRGSTSGTFLSKSDSVGTPRGCSKPFEFLLLECCKWQAISHVSVTSIIRSLWWCGVVGGLRNAAVGWCGRTWGERIIELRCGSDAGEKLSQVESWDKGLNKHLSGLCGMKSSADPPDVLNEKHMWRQGRFTLRIHC